MNSCELIDSLLVDLNNLIKQQMTGQYVAGCATVHQMAQKLTLLRNGVEDDMKSMTRKVEDLKAELKACGNNVQDVAAEKLLGRNQSVNSNEKDGDG